MEPVGTFQELCKSLRYIVKLESEGKAFQFSYSRDLVQKLEICKDKLKEVETFFNDPPSFSGYRKIRSKLAHLINRVGLKKPEEDKQEQLDLKSEALTKTSALLTRLDTDKTYFSVSTRSHYRPKF
ncbi:hypothetical protein HHI36_014748 [Cryptolaemus montrouzieri]|uniref:Uncharacterized protein n=1 Tax=Cryptolaemus montrouzieri TaxID=559131 RepID=A0ABD2N3S0_9CUCU